MTMHPIPSTPVPLEGRPLPRRAHDRWMALLALALVGVTAACVVALQLERTRHARTLQAHQAQLAAIDALHRQRLALQRIDRALAALALASDSEGVRWVAAIRADLAALEGSADDSPAEAVQGAYAREVAHYVAHWPALALPPDPALFVQFDRALAARHEAVLRAPSPAAWPSPPASAAGAGAVPKV